MVRHEKRVCVFVVLSFFALLLFFRAHVGVGNDQPPMTFVSAVKTICRSTPGLEMQLPTGKLCPSVARIAFCFRSDSQRAAMHRDPASSCHAGVYQSCLGNRRAEPVNAKRQDILQARPYHRESCCFVVFVWSQRMRNAAKKEKTLTQSYTVSAHRSGRWKVFAMSLPSVFGALL